MAQQTVKCQYYWESLWIRRFLYGKPCNLKLKFFVQLSFCPFKTGMSYSVRTDFFSFAGLEKNFNKNKHSMNWMFDDP